MYATHKPEAVTVPERIACWISVTLSMAVAVSSMSPFSERCSD